MAWEGLYVFTCVIVENLLRTGNVSTDSCRLSLSEQPTRISAVQFQDDVIDHEDKQVYFIELLNSL